MPGKRILILGGTREARELAAVLLEEGYEVITSLAGVTENPILPEGQVRRGGFGGVEGLVAYLRHTGIAAIADATHPFAAQMSRQAYAAATLTTIPLVRLERPAWQAQAGDTWISVRSCAEAAAALPAGARALVTIGRKEIALFFARPDIGGVARMIEPPALEVPSNWTVLLERPPFRIEDDMALITHHAITHVVSKNAGGEDTKAKLAAARTLAVPVIMVTRPPKPVTRSYTTAAEVAHFLRAEVLP